MKGSHLEVSKNILIFSYVFKQLCACMYLEKLVKGGKCSDYIKLLKEVGMGQNVKDLMRVTKQ